MHLVQTTLVARSSDTALTQDPEKKLHPVVLTSLVMKAIERIMKEHIFSFPNSQLSWLQFACRTGRGINYVKAFIIDTFTLDD